MANRFIRSASILLIAALLECNGAYAQELKPQNDPVVDPELDPNPFDPRAELREYFRGRLTGGWWASEPIYNLSMFHVLLHAPKGWRGNPNSAVANLCPDRDHPIWKGLSAFAVQAFHQQHSWAEVTCRP